MPHAKAAAPSPARAAAVRASIDALRQRSKAAFSAAMLGGRPRAGGAAATAAAAAAEADAAAEAATERSVVVRDDPNRIV